MKYKELRKLIKEEIENISNEPPLNLRDEYEQALKKGWKNIC